MVTVCQTCGDRGFSVALIYCDKCQCQRQRFMLLNGTAVMIEVLDLSYCLFKLPKTFEEYVVWFCVDCEPKAVESSSLQQAVPATSPQSRLKDSIVGRSKGKNDIKIKKKKKKKKRKRKKIEYGCGSLAESNVQRQSSQTPRESSIVGGTSSSKEAVLTEAKASPSNSCSHSRGSDWINIDDGAGSINNSMSLVAIDEHLNIIENNSSDGWKEVDDKYSNDVAGHFHAVATGSQIPRNVYVPAQPIFESIWRGSFDVSVENLTIEVVAHLSSLACLKVCETAKCLPQLLHLELLLRCDVWPKGFKKSGPSDESIALYFFPSDEREVKIFDNLIDKMIGKDLGIRVIVQDVELLVYTSNLLPANFQRFQEKFYLWGVFRAKQPSHLTNGEDNSCATALTWDSCSPISPLSDNGSSLFGYGNS
ncbi:hypothetical protein V6N13_009189 [Hibiscus sabdariffa]|uniref:AIPP2-like SPOC-like domain-containing protein n=1 Tax=Hibiscus sabdariffa TaxID=183260 RepID=A0ABR2DHU7_9ROSI